MKQLVIPFVIMIGLTVIGGVWFPQEPVAGVSFIGFAMFLGATVLIMKEAAKLVNHQKMIIAKLTAPRSKPPISREKFEQKRTAFKIMRPFYVQNRPWKEISAIFKTKYPHLPHSEKTLRQILKEGLVGQLDHWPPDQETTDQ